MLVLKNKKVALYIHVLLAKGAAFTESNCGYITYKQTWMRLDLMPIAVCLSYENIFFGKGSISKAIDGGQHFSSV